MNNMKKLSGEEIVKIIRSNYSEEDFAYGYWTKCSKLIECPSEIESGDEKKKWVLNELGLGDVKEVAQHGGEGEGSRWWSVKYFKDHDVYIRIDGSYTSYYGTDFYDGHGYVVTPKEKLITVYE